MKIKQLVLCALFCALLCIFAPISVPITAVPISLSTFIIYIAAAILPAYLSALSVLSYVILGAVGLPVFSGFMGGASVLLSPVGGFVIGYIPCALTISLLKKHISRPLAMGLGTLVLYSFGASFFAVYSHAPFLDALLVCVLPFLLGDALKIFLASYICKKSEKQLEKLLE